MPEAYGMNRNPLRCGLLDRRQDAIPEVGEADDHICSLGDHAADVGDRLLGIEPCARVHDLRRPQHDCPGSRCDCRLPRLRECVLAPIKEATAKGIPFIPYASGIVGEPGVDYPGVVGEDLCLVGKSFARVLNGQAKNGTVVFLGGTPGNPLSAGSQNWRSRRSLRVSSSAATPQHTGPVRGRWRRRPGT